MTIVIEKLSAVEPALLDENTKQNKPTQRQNTSTPSTTSATSATSGFRLGWGIFTQLEQPTSYVMVAYMAVYLTVLSPSGLLTAWLTASDVPAGTIATFRAASQLVRGF